MAIEGGGGRTRSRPPRRTRRGFALFTTLVLTVIVAVVLGATLRTVEFGERLSGSSIERHRAFNAAEGGLRLGERALAEAGAERTFASADGRDGTFAFASVDDAWWRDPDFDGATAAPAEAFVGVIAPPEYVIEEVGAYVADGGSGIVSLDRGSAGYGSKTDSGREVVLYRVQSRGNGSAAPVDAVVESLFVQAQ